MGKEHDYAFIENEIQMISKHLTTCLVMKENINLTIKILTIRLTLVEHGLESCVETGTLIYDR